MQALLSFTDILFWKFKFNSFFQFTIRRKIEGITLDFEKR